MSEVVQYQTLYCCWKELFYTFAIEKYKPVQSPSFYTSLINSCRSSHLEGVAFLKSSISC